MTTDTAASGTAHRTSGTAPGAAPRDRLLDAAAELFYRRGVGTPTDDLCRAAKISKRSMYRMFDGKDTLLAAALEHRAPAFADLLLPPPDLDAGPRARMLYVFERLEEAALSPGYLGCPYVAAQVELKDPAHPASVVAADAKRDVLDFFRAEAQRAGIADPDLLARQLAVVYDGASTRAGIGADDLRGLAVTTAAALITTAGVTH
ncbi:TetR family transcriptional regulator [Streptomyces sp. NPDC026672]|uniref:TetR/AcrR family transcriptional regulator n=1 Tax=unclassified Streptomyces TaxID=2593676 RepID=UPI0033CF5DB7